MRSWLRFLAQRGRVVAYRLPAPPAIRMIADLIFRTFQNFSRDDGSHLAAGVAYYAIFSLFPLLLATFAVAGFFAGEEIHDRLFEIIDELVPGSAGSALIRENIEALVNARGALGLFAFIGLLWSARAVFGAVHRVLNRAWKVTEPPHFLIHQLGQIAAAVSAALLFIGSSGLGTVGRAIAAEAEVLPQLPWGLLIAILIFGVSTVLFVFVYRFVPDASVRWREAIVAGLLAGIAFEGAKIGFSYYLANLSSLDLVYGSVTTIVALMLFLYVVALILVWCAELTSELSRTDKAGMLDIRGHLRPVAGGLASVHHRPVPSGGAPEPPTNQGGRR